MKMPHHAAVLLHVCLMQFNHDFDFCRYGHHAAILLHVCLNFNAIQSCLCFMSLRNIHNYI